MNFWTFRLQARPTDLDEIMHPWRKLKFVQRIQFLPHHSDVVANLHEVQIDFLKIKWFTQQKAFTSHKYKSLYDLQNLV
jgi:hypothetical protein